MSLPPYKPPFALGSPNPLLELGDPGSSSPSYDKLAGLLAGSPPPEPEIPETLRKVVAWANLPGLPTDAFKTSKSGRTIWWDAHGDRKSMFGWEIDHRAPLAMGGRHTRSNLIARHWEDNARSGGLLGALMR